MKENKIFIILPFKESLNPKTAGAVSIYVRDALKYSKYIKKIKIISSDQIKLKIFRNKNYILNFCKKYSKKKIDIIEVHNRPEYIKYLKKYFPETKFILTFHNDPLKLRGSVKINERENLLKDCHKVIFISRWIQSRFFNSFVNSNYDNTKIIYHGVLKNNKLNIKKKKKNILFVGKLNKAKGYDIFVETAKLFKKFDDTWNFIAIGDEPRKQIFPEKNIVNEVGYKTNNEVLKYYSNSEIAVGNSVWQEPLGRIAIESSSRKCLPIISNVAGLAESKKIAYVLKTNNSDELFKILKKLTQNDVLRKKLQKKFYIQNDFDIKKISRLIDKIRDDSLNIKSHIIKNKNLKVLHIANFNELSDGRLFYSFSNKLNNGFLKNNHIVQTISDRVFLKNNKNLFNPYGNYKLFNNKILNTIKNFSPDTVIFGHVFNIDQKIFDYCKTNNIKTANWFIDSISSEFLNNKKRNLFFDLINKVDKTFLTSSPELFRKLNFYKKLKFIPNPVDNSIDIYENYKHGIHEYDIFFAISHGQNRVILKHGKKDERENVFNYISDKLSNYKIASFGMNSVEPVWGSNYFYHLSRSKIALNISRGSYQKYYSSDRISSLIGNGLLVFIDDKTKLHKFLKNKKHVVYFKNKEDLVKKIKYYLNNDKLRQKIARTGCQYYHKKFSNTNVAKYILSELGFNKFKINW